MLTDDDRAWARQTAARLRPPSEETRDELALLLRPAVVAVRQARRAPKAAATAERRQAAAGHHDA